MPRYEVTGPTGTAVVNIPYSTRRLQDVSTLDLRPGNEYTFEVRAVDAAGNRSVQPAVFRFETTPPGAATGLRQVTTRSGYPELIEWTAAPDNAAIMTYEIFLNGESLGHSGIAAPRVDLFEQITGVACIDPLSAPLTVVFP